MTKLIAILILTCATAFAQTVIVKGTGAGAVHRSGTGAGSVRGVATPRFTVPAGNTNVVIDNNSGLMWTRNAGISGGMYWSNAVAFCVNLETNGYSDWRLPSLAEFSKQGSATGLLDGFPSANNPALPLGHPFTSIAETYWANTVDSPGYVWFVDSGDGWANTTTYEAWLYSAWPCRGP